MQMHIVQDSRSYPLLSTASKQAVERLHQSILPEHFLMQQAGLRVAQWVQALQAHAQVFWIVCGPGNNGGDGLIAATHLLEKGKQVRVTYCGNPNSAREDAAWAYQQAMSKGVTIEYQLPDQAFLETVECVIDAMLGIGANRPLEGLMRKCTQWINQLENCFVFSVDIPSGLHADSGAVLRSEESLPESHELHAWVVKADATLSLIALSLGLFTAYGKDCAGQVWLETLIPTSEITSLDQSSHRQIHSQQSQATEATAHLVSDSNQAQLTRESQTNELVDLADVIAYGQSPMAWLATRPVLLQRPHASHKGSFGSVAVVAGAKGMQGAALLAAQAAMHAGAGKVYLSFLTTDHCPHPIASDLILQRFEQLALADMTVVCGCGGSVDVAEVLPKVLANSPRLVLDADALQCIAKRPDLQEMLQMRAGLGLITVLTPHPKEAAHLLHWTLSKVQNKRLEAVQNLASFYHAVVVLKGTGSLIAAPFVAPTVNTTGNALLAIAGTGDVLAGMVGSLLAQGLSAFEAAKTAVYYHGKIADLWDSQSSLTAVRMLEKIPRFSR